MPARRSSSSRKSRRNSTDSDELDKSHPIPSQEDPSVKCDDEKIDDKPLEDDSNDDEPEKPVSSLPPDYWFPPKCESKEKFAITDITSGNVTITFRELI